MTMCYMIKKMIFEVITYRAFLKIFKSNFRKNMPLTSNFLEEILLNIRKLALTISKSLTN